MRALAVLLGALAAAGCASAPRAPYEPPSEERLQRELARVHKKNASLPRRVEGVSALFLGAPYKLGPLGEGPDAEFDRDPLLRFDEFDCTTYVETVMALSLRSDLAGARDAMRRIRYKDGQIGYATRNHFTELDWIPHNVWAGYLRDITEEVAGEKTLRVAKLVSKREWYARMSTATLEGRFTPEERAKALPRLRAVGQAFEDQRAVLAVLPMEELPNALPRIPSGTIANLVRADQPGKDTIVSHQVLLIRKKDGWYVRHAAFGKEVEDDPILDYFARYKGSSWPLLGLNLDVLRDPGKPELQTR